MGFNVDSFELISTIVFFCIGIFLFWQVPNFQKHTRYFTDNEVHLPPLSVIIPARNEEKRILPLLNSLKMQTIRPDEVLIIDDDSEDKTAELAFQAGFSVIRNAPLPKEGWTGKNWACWQGALYASGEILIFLDADVRLEKDALEKLVLVHQKKGGLISVQPYHEVYKVYEQLSAFFNIILMAALNAFTPFKEKIKPSGAFGPCLICSKKDYFSVGGHKSGSGVVLDSLPLGRAFGQNGLGVHLFGGKGALNFRMYPNGIGELVEGWSKGFGSGAFSVNPLFMLLCVAWVWGCFSVSSDLISSLITQQQGLTLSTIFYLLYAAQVYWMIRRIGSFHWLTSLFFIIPLIFFGLIMVRSVILTFVLHRVKWHGREIPIDGLR